MRRKFLINFIRAVSAGVLIPSVPLLIIDLKDFFEYAKWVGIGVMGLGVIILLVDLSKWVIRMLK